MRSPKAFLDKTALSRPTRKQARPLRTTEVVYLEEFLKDAGNDVRDRYAAGVFLFALYAISRWSDLKVVQNFFLDVDIVDGKSVGFVEFRTFSHKTASQVAKHGLFYAISGANLGPDRSAMGHSLEGCGRRSKSFFWRFQSRTTITSAHEAGNVGHAQHQQH